MSEPDNRIDYEGLLKRALARMDELQHKLDKPYDLINERIAIVGIGCRLPGGLNDPEAFWQFLLEGGDAVTEFPPDRWSVDDFYDPDPDKPGKTYVRHGAFLDHVDTFDPEVFGISPREATSMDPQQRVLLEVTWEALENAGKNPMVLAGSKTGVFIGISSNDYSLLQTTGDLSIIDTYFGVGAAHSIASGRISYVFGLEGPSVSLDTACSSSLLAAHLACQSLRLRECDMAIAGGVNLILALDATITASKARMLSRQGRCKTFDESADGYVRSEGCGVVVLKRLEDAVANNDDIVGIIRGTAANHDGRSNGLTAPSARSQERVIKRAIENAGLSAPQIGYIEAHGTATNLGDPIEIQALGEVFGTSHSPSRPLLVGSVKTNIGHLEAAAGVTGLIKVALALKHKTIPPHLHLKRLNPLVPWDDYPFSIPVGKVAWDTPDNTRIAGVSSFGFSGTNVHMILEEVAKTEAETNRPERPVHLCTLSATDTEALSNLARAYGTAGDHRLADICFTANSGRHHFAHRAAVIAPDTKEWHARMASIPSGIHGVGVAKGVCTEDFAPQIVFLYTGQGSQYAAMAKDLYETQPTFRREMDRCDQVLQLHLKRSLLGIIYGAEVDQRLLDQTAYTQPALFAVEYALSRLWQSWGIEPAAVMGHSVGEYVAACIAGLFSLEDGLRLIATRGRMIQQLPLNGGMLAVLGDEQTVRQMIATQFDTLSVAAVNGPHNTVVSGELDAIRKAAVVLQESGLRTQQLKVSHAFHSRLMEPILDGFENAAGQVRCQPLQIPLLSNVTGKFFDDANPPDAGYWRDHMRKPVRFADAVKTLYETGYRTFVEVGPHPTLLGMLKTVLPDAALHLYPTLRKGKQDWQQILETLAGLYVVGVNPNWSGFDGDYRRRRVSLPTYPFKKRRFWVDAATQGAMLRKATSASSGDLTSLHPLLGRKVKSASRDIQYEVRMSSAWPDFIKDHMIHDKIVVPGACHISMVLSAAREIFGHAACEITDVAFPEPLVIHEDGGERTVQLISSPEQNGVRSFGIYSFQEGIEGHAGNWVLHASGKMNRMEEGFDNQKEDGRGHLAVIRDRCKEQIPLTETHYRRAADVGLALGPSFRWIGPVWRGDNEALGLMQPPIKSLENHPYQLHPGLLDACFQLLGGAVPDDLDSGELLWLPVGFSRMRFFSRPQGEIWCRAAMKSEVKKESETLSADLHLFDDKGILVAVINDLYLKRAPRDALLRIFAEDIHRLFYQVQWMTEDVGEHAPNHLPETDGQPLGWIVLAEENGVGRRLTRMLEERGDYSILVYPGDEFRQSRQNQYEINPSALKDYQRLFAELSEREMPPIWRIVYLWGLRSIKESSMGDDLPHRRQALICGGALKVVQRVAALERLTSTKVWFVTGNVHPIGPAPAEVAIDQAPLWGLGRVVAWEYPNLWGGLVDLPGNVQDADLSTLIDVMASTRIAPQLALRNGRCYEASLSPQRPAASGVQWVAGNERGTYLITGGFGGLGLEVARWLAEKGARHLMLVGRSAPSQSARQIIDQIEQIGADVSVARCDVSNPRDVERVLLEINEDLPPLRGVIHAAGTLDDGILEQQNWERFDKVMAPKISGAWYLHHFTKNMDLDFFVLFSSMAAILGSAGQANYAAANAYLDALSDYRRMAGLPSLSINWGAWSETGMAANLRYKDQDALSSMGMRPLSNDKGLRALDTLLGASETQTNNMGGCIGVIDADWQRLADHSPEVGKMSLIRHLVARSAKTESRPKERASESLKFSTLEAHERADALKHWLAEQIGNLLGIRSSELKREKSIISLGFDSLMAVQLKNAIEVETGVLIPVAQMLEGPSLLQLVNLIESNFDVDEAGKDQGSGVASHADTSDEMIESSIENLDAVDAGRLLEKLDDLSDKQVEEMLLRLASQGGDASQD